MNGWQLMSRTIFHGIDGRIGGLQKVQKPPHNAATDRKVIFVFAACNAGKMILAAKLNPCNSNSHQILIVYCKSQINEQQHAYR